MTLEDPFFVVKDEVCKALNKTRGLYQRWSDLKPQEEHQQEGHPSTPGVVYSGNWEDLEWTQTELRNSLRSIEWDLEDLEETIGIVEKHPKKFKIDVSELSGRKYFIEETKQEVQCMKEALSQSRRESSSKQLNIEESPLKMPQVATYAGNTKYSRLVNEADSPNGDLMERTVMQQQLLMSQQDDQLDQLASSVGNLKHMTLQIGQEVDEQAVMLDDFGNEMENTQGKMESTLGKMAKVLKLTNDRRQWAAIGALSGLLVVVVVLYFLI